MLKLVVLALVATTSLVYGAGELSILHHPASIQFKGHEHVKESTLKEIYSAALGFSTEHYSSWRGLSILDPFNLAEAVVTVSIDGVSDIGQQKGHHFPLRTNEDEDAIYRALEKRVNERYPESDAQFIKINLASGLEDLQQYEVFKSIKSDKPKKTHLNHLKLINDEDREFLKEIHLLSAVSDKVKQGGIAKVDFIPDVYWFTLPGLHSIVDLYGENSTQAKEAKILLNTVLLEVNDAFNSAYKGSVLVNVVTSDASHTRRSRSILETKDEPADDTKYNLAKNYGKDYPVFFNIILWFGVIMVFSLLAICLAIANMDPGRDSIIYRMTSTRMKKDN